MNKKKGKPENEENREFNYEDILNQISSENKPDLDKNPSEDGIVLSELLAGIESKEEVKKVRKKKQPPKEKVNPDIDIISDINLDDFSVDNNEKESFAAPKKDKFEIDLGGLDDSEDIDYASLLSELDKQDLNTSKTYKSYSGEKAPELKETDDIELDITGESIYDSLISGLEEDKNQEESENKSPEFTFSLDDLITDVKEPEQSKTPAKEEDLMSGITASYDALIEDITVIPEQTIEQAFPELEDEPTPDSAFKTEGSEYSTPSEDDDILKAFDETSISMEEELLAGYASSDQADDNGELKADEITPLSDDEDILNAETVVLEALKDESMPSDMASLASLEESVQDDTSQAQTFVIPSMNSDDEEEDFLKLNVDAPAPKKEEDQSLLAGIADVKSAPLALTEILMPGIDMDPREQTEAVTRAEVLIAQGKIKEATEIYASIAKKKGVTPFVAKRLKELV